MVICVVLFTTADVPGQPSSDLPFEKTYGLSSRQVAKLLRTTKAKTPSDGYYDLKEFFKAQGVEFEPDSFVRLHVSRGLLKTKLTTQNHKIVELVLDDLLGTKFYRPQKTAARASSRCAAGG
jgi:hypothetical protein